MFQSQAVSPSRGRRLRGRFDVICSVYRASELKVKRAYHRGELIIKRTDTISESSPV